MQRTGIIPLFLLLSFAMQVLISIFGMEKTLLLYQILIESEAIPLSGICLEILNQTVTLRKLKIEMMLVKMAFQGTVDFRVKVAEMCWC